MSNLELTLRAESEAMMRERKRRFCLGIQGVTAAMAGMKAAIDGAFGTPWWEDGQRQERIDRHLARCARNRRRRRKGR